MSPKKTKRPFQQRGDFIKSPEPLRSSTNTEYPVFCLQHNHRDYTINDCETDEQAALVRQLSTLSRFTWGKITLMKHDQYGYEHIPADQIKPNAPTSITQPLNQYMVFRFQNGDGRIIGYREDRIYHIIWVDAKLQAYKH